MEHMFNNL